MKQLSHPDELLGSISAGMHVILLSDEETPPLEIVGLFQEKGVEITVLTMEETQVNDESIQARLKSIAEQKGDIDGFLYLAGTSPTNMQLPFFFAKHLSRYFHRSKHPSRKAFVIVLSLDGAFGLSGSSDWSPDLGALTGLVKTLHQEWPLVFTRVVDLALGFADSTTAEKIFAEWTDVDARLVEVGLSEESRLTVEFEVVSD